MTDRVSQGSPHVWSAVVTDGNDDAIDALTLVLTVTDPVGDIVAGFPITLSGLSHDGLGLYSYSWTVPVDADPGTYAADWTGSDTADIDVHGTDSVIVLDASTAAAFYSGNPDTSPKDAVRFLIQDTNENDIQFSNSELAYLLALSDGNALVAAARAAERLVAKYARAVDKSVGNLRISASQKAEAYRKLAETLWDQANRGAFTPGTLVMPWAGGISRSDKRSRRLDADRVRPAFTRGMMRYPGVGTVVSPLGEEQAP